MKRALTLLLGLTLACAANAEKYAIVGAKIHTMTEQGTVEFGSVLVVDGKIESVVEGDIIPDGYTRIDGAGKVVTPGLIGAMTSLGLVEVSSSAGTVDASTKEYAISNTGAALDVSYAVNPDSSLIPVSRIDGITSAATGIGYSDFLFSGQGAVITLSGKGNSVLKPRAFVKLDVSGNAAEHIGGTRAALWVAVEQALSEAKSVNGELSASSDWDGLNTRADVAALKGVVSGDVPLFVTADRLADIHQVIALKARHPDLNLVLLHAVEAWRAADELAKAGISVVLDPELNLPGGFDQLGATLANAARLHKAGVKVAIGMSTHNIRLATQHAGNAVAYGLPHDAALAALTSNVADMLGMGDKLGKLSSGYQADLVVWSGDPLEVAQAAEAVMINGELMPMESRQTRLRDRYIAVQLEKQGPTSHYVRP